MTDNATLEAKVAALSARVDELESSNKFRRITLYLTIFTSVLITLVAVDTVWNYLAG